MLFIIVSIIIYLMSSILYYFVLLPKITPYVMRNPEKPLFAFLVKWIYALGILFSITQIQKHPYRYYKWLNTISFGVLFLWIMLCMFFLNFESDLELVLLESIVLAIFIFINSRFFRRRYHIRSNPLYFVIFMIVRPLIWTACVFYVLKYCYTLSDDWSCWTFSLP
jgi:hypothetical protein